MLLPWIYSSAGLTEVYQYVTIKSVNLYKYKTAITYKENSK